MTDSDDDREPTLREQIEAHRAIPYDVVPKRPKTPEELDAIADAIDELAGDHVEVRYTEIDEDGVTEHVEQHTVTPVFRPGKHHESEE